ncbi:hypothetical protein JMA_03520 [Jeotgalibacillus malaysiensis]|uniref:DUF4181 domain-containing protein n=1 Tax=Jeotgalibacillus malaysiensis TaxID=1508404 RepID=A0A0B5ANS3_9BACL|nr:DUF4181 domain-containing protein [Jeotgalibacillus malaysiensis]AJD89669.1 hypothetical protein JMA_03520 [Jeotgalibacillus malaysiensis]
MNFLEDASDFEVYFTIAVLVGIAVSFSPIMRRLIGADKIKMFSWENYVNQQHKKLDWIIRISAIIAMIVLWAIQMSVFEDGGGLKWYLGAPMALFLMILFTETLRIYMEWKHSENRQNYKATLLDLVFLLFLTFICLSTGLFGAFEFGWQN